MEFYSRTNKPPVIDSPSGEEVVPVFSLVIDKETGKKELKATGKTNIYKLIQEHKEECLIYNILERYAMGDETVLDKVKGVYCDITGVPKSLNEAQDMILNAENVFNDLPVEIRGEFNHSVTEFIASISNGTLDKKLSKFSTPPTQTKDLKATDVVTQPAQEQSQTSQEQSQTSSTGVNLGGNI